MLPGISRRWKKMSKIADISNGESMASVRTKLNAAIERANQVGMPVNTVADLPSDPEDYQAHFVRSLGYAVHWIEADSAWFNPMANEVTSADE